MAFGTLNFSDEAPVRVDVAADRDEYPFITLSVLHEDGGDEIVDVLIKSEQEADELLAEVTKAVERFKGMLRG